jgi:hypothetical protein
VFSVFIRSPCGKLSEGRSFVHNNPTSRELPNLLVWGNEFDRIMTLKFDILARTEKDTHLAQYNQL